jgi:hypothetical protein
METRIAADMANDGGQQQLLRCRSWDRFDAPATEASGSLHRFARFMD